MIFRTRPRSRTRKIVLLKSVVIRLEDEYDDEDEDDDEDEYDEDEYDEDEDDDEDDISTKRVSPT